VKKVFIRHILVSGCTHSNCVQVHGSNQVGKGQGKKEIWLSICHHLSLITKSFSTTTKNY